VGGSVFVLPVTGMTVWGAVQWSGDHVPLGETALRLRGLPVRPWWRTATPASIATRGYASMTVRPGRSRSGLDQCAPQRRGGAGPDAVAVASVGIVPQRLPVWHPPV